MKKMFFVISMVCATMAANAASISWGIDNFTIPPLQVGEQWGASGATAYLFVGNNTAGIADAIENGTFSTASNVGQLITAYGGASSPPVPTVPTVDIYNLFVVVIGTKAGINPDLDEQYYMISSVKQGLSYEGTSEAEAIVFEIGDFAGFNGGTWKPIPIPEPATMALVGIGIVALGLRRRRK